MAKCIGEPEVTEDADSNPARGQEGGDVNKTKIEWCDYYRGWLEGIIDGEGSLSLFREKRTHFKDGYTYKPQLSIGSNDRVLVERVKEIIGAGAIVANRAKIRKHILWQYSLNANGLRKLLPRIKLLIKDRQRLLLLEALEILETRRGGNGRWHRPDGSMNRLVEIWKQMRRLNKHE